MLWLFIVYGHNKESLFFIISFHLYIQETPKKEKKLKSEPFVTWKEEEEEKNTAKEPIIIVIKQNNNKKVY
jgi:hypothetical protein